MNHQGLICAGHRKDGRSPPWQLPQGGIQQGEPPAQAVFRELVEELGTSKAVIVEACPHWLQYDYPDAHSTRRAQLYRGQRHKWFLMRFTGADRDIDVHTPTPEFSAWRWMSPDDAVASVIAFKRDVYRAVMLHFAPALGHAKPTPSAIPPAMITQGRRDDLARQEGPQASGS